MNLTKFNFDAPTPWGVYFQDSATPANILRDKLSNSGDFLYNVGLSWI